MGIYNVTELDGRTHVYRFPDTYIGSTVEFQREDLIFQGGKLKWTQVDMPPGLHRCFEEVINNAADNMIRAHEENWRPPLPFIDVSFDKQEGWITIRNGGPGIPIVQMPPSMMYLPEIIFSHLRSSSHYEDTQRMSAGKNGYGAKLCNIFSKKFIIDVRTNGVRYVQRWSENMLNREEPDITTSEDDDQAADYVQVQYLIDFQRFGREEYMANDIYLMARTAYDYTCSVKAPVKINGQAFDMTSALEYMEAFGTNRPIAYYLNDQLTSSNLPPIELALMAYEGGGCMSFVNGIRTSHGGVHVDAAWKRVTQILSEEWSKVSPVALKSNVLMVLVVHAPNPIFRSQVKDYLVSPRVQFKELERQHLLPLIKDKELEKAVAHVREKISSAEKIDVDKDSLERPYIMEAADAGTHRGMTDGILMLVEGKSARGYADDLIKFLPQGHNKYGVFNLIGKLLNVYDEDRCKQSVIIRQITNMLGIGTNGLPQRYHSVWIMADQDEDGRHITMLILYFLYKCALNMVKLGRVFIYNSPLIRVKLRNAEHMNFYDEGSYRTWAAAGQHGHAQRHQMMWMKGLGSSSREDVQRDASNINLTKITIDDSVEPVHDLFQSASVLRKGLCSDNISIQFSLSQEIDCWSYIKTYYPEYARLSTTRAIPAIDGLKEIQRLVVWAALKKWAAHNDPRQGLRKDLTPVKLEQFAGYVSETLHYHSKEDHISNAIIHMATPYQNNYPLFHPHGQYGNMMSGIGGAAKPRYLHTSPAPLMRVLFHPDDSPLYTMKRVDGQEGGPEFLLPVLPYFLINGTSALGIGCYMYSPPFNPVDMVDYLLYKLDTDSHKPARIPKPWIRNYTGTLAIRSSKRGAYRPDESDDEIETGAKSWLENVGTWDIEKRRGNELDIKITSLPMRQTVDKLLLRLRDLAENHVIVKYKNNVTTDKIDIRVIGITLQNAIYNRQISARKMQVPKMHPKNITEIPLVLGLRRCFSMNSLFTVDPTSGCTKHYASVSQLLDGFYAWRLPFYERRRSVSVESLAARAADKQKRKSFVSDMVSGRITYMNVPTGDVLAQLEARGYPAEFYENSMTKHFSNEQIIKLERETAEITLEMEQQRTKTAKDLWREDLMRLREFFEQK
jgi:DNA topoisomerase II